MVYVQSNGNGTKSKFAIITLLLFIYIILIRELIALYFSISADIIIVIAVTIFVFIIGILYIQCVVVHLVQMMEYFYWQIKLVKENVIPTYASVSAPETASVSAIESASASAPTAYGSSTPTFNNYSNSSIQEDNPPSYEEPPTYDESVQLRIQQEILKTWFFFEKMINSIPPINIISLKTRIAIALCYLFMFLNKHLIIYTSNSCCIY